MDLKPKLSIVLPAFAGFDAVALARSSWEAQTRRRDLEILIVCPEGQGPRQSSARRSRRARSSSTRAPR